MINDYDYTLFSSEKNYKILKMSYTNIYFLIHYFILLFTLICYIILKMQYPNINMFIYYLI